jgi:hypothetical protein
MFAVYSAIADSSFLVMVQSFDHGLQKDGSHAIESPEMILDWYLPG